MHCLAWSPRALCLETVSQIHREMHLTNPVQLTRLTSTAGISLSTWTSLLIGPCLDPSNKLKEPLVSIAPVEESVPAFIFGVTCRALARE